MLWSPVGTGLTTALGFLVCDVYLCFCHFPIRLDWLQSLKQFSINVSYHILVASLTLMALF